MSYATHVSTRQTPQSEPIPGKQQIENSAGGFAFAVDCWTRLDRFLILGNEGGSYYATERKLTQENAVAILECASQDGLRTVNRIVEISEAGRAPKNDPAIFALALLAGQRASYSSAAMEAMPRVCRIGTHLFQFVESVQHFRGWGRALRRSVANWYTSKPAADLAYQVTKYQQRGSWSHHDLLHKCHAKPPSQSHQYLFHYVKDGTLFADSELALLSAVKQAQHAKDSATIVRLIRDYKLVRECIPTEHLNSPEVWEALLENMPMTAMLRNLGKMSAVGLLKPMSAACKTICDRLGDVERLKKARVHPLAILIAHSIYAQGRGFKGSLTWSPDSSIVDALDSAFYSAFSAVEPTGKRYYLGLDVSGSMNGGSIAGTFLTPRVASAAMAIVTVQAEAQTYSAGFTSSSGRMYNRDNGMTEISLSRKMRLDTVVKTISALPMGGTDCALPMLDALEKGIQADVFVIYTDNETWAGSIHPCQALQRYRDKMGIPAKLIVCGMVSNGFTIAGPNDAGMLDVVGFDASVPQVMAEFAR